MKVRNNFNVEQARVIHCLKQPSFNPRNRSRDRENFMKKKAEKKSSVEKERLEDVAGYDRKFDPIAEAADLKIAERHRRIDKK